MSVVKPLGKHVIVNPVSRWNPAVMKAITEINLPVVQNEMMPVGRLYIIDPAEIEPLPVADLPLDRMIEVAGA